MGFFFFNDIERDGFANARLESFPTLVSEFLDILKWDVIEAAYAPFKGEISEPILIVFRNQILPNCYLCEMPDCIFGATS